MAAHLDASGRDARAGVGAMAAPNGVGECVGVGVGMGNGGGGGAACHEPPVTVRIHGVLDSLRGGHMFQFGRVSMGGVLPDISVPIGAPAANHGHDHARHHGHGHGHGQGHGQGQGHGGAAAPTTTLEALRFPLSTSDCRRIIAHSQAVDLEVLESVGSNYHHHHHHHLHHQAPPNRRGGKRRRPKTTPCYVMDVAHMRVSTPWVKAVVHPVALSVARAVLGVAARDADVRVVPAALIAIPAFSGGCVAVHSGAGRVLHPCLSKARVSAAAVDGAATSGDGSGVGSHEAFSGHASDQFPTFATVDVVLPCLHEGAGMLVRANGQSVSVPYGDGRRGMSFLAFHSLARVYCQPITSGMRVVLRCMVQSHVSAAQPRFRPSTGSNVLAMSKHVHAWVTTPGADAVMAYVFEHKYSHSELTQQPPQIMDNDKVCVADAPPPTHTHTAHLLPRTLLPAALSPGPVYVRRAVPCLACGREADVVPRGCACGHVWVHMWRVWHMWACVGMCGHVWHVWACVGT